METNQESILSSTENINQNWKYTLCSVLGIIFGISSVLINLLIHNIDFRKPDFIILLVLGLITGLYGAIGGSKENIRIALILGIVSTFFSGFLILFFVLISSI